MRVHNRRMSSASCVNKPGVSSVGAKGNSPSVGRSPYAGLNPATPQYDAGLPTEPCVCEPSAKAAMPAATAAADPLELPPGECAGSCGLRVGDGSNEAKTVVCVLPRRMAPSFRSFVTSAALVTPLRPA